MFINTFIKSESGAVTVDWVVLTASIVSIAIAVLVIIASGINTASNETNTQIEGAIDNSNIEGQIEDNSFTITSGGN